MPVETSQIVFAALAVAVVGFAVYQQVQAKPKAPLSLFERLGGDAAVDAAVDKFYDKVINDVRIKHFFAHTNMTTQRKKQVSFMCMAFGKPGMKYQGLSMDAAHRRLVKEGMNDSHFDAVAEDLANTLLEMGVAKSLVDEVIVAVGGLREQVMCRGKWAAQ